MWVPSFTLYLFLCYYTCRKHQIFISRPESLLKRHCKVLHERGLAVGVFPYYIGGGGGWTVVKSAAALEAKKRKKHIYNTGIKRDCI